jgi:hypothetical protein
MSILLGDDREAYNRAIPREIPSLLGTNPSLDTSSMVGPRERRPVLQFVWSDDLAGLLVDEGEATPAEVAEWMTRIIGYRLPEGRTPLQFALELWDRYHEADEGRRAS